MDIPRQHRDKQMGLQENEYSLFDFKSEKKEFLPNDYRQSKIEKRSSKINLLTKKEPTFSKKFLRLVIASTGLIIILLGIYAFYNLSKKDLFGWRLNFNFTKAEIKTYKSVFPVFSFKYPKIFELDLDQDKKYGNAYISGIKLTTDSRTGCDIRRGGPKLDFSKLNQSLLDETIGPIKERTTEFRLFESEKTNIGGRQAFFISFSFLDPIGARVRLDQFFLEGQESYMIICGTGEYQYAFFEKDFQIFYNSLDFASNNLKIKNN